MSKGPTYSGPTLHGWGRTVQKRRLEMETVENKYGKKTFGKTWDQAGCVYRTTDYLQVRTFWNMGTRWSTWLFYGARDAGIVLIPCTFTWQLCMAEVRYGDRLRRAAWW